MTAFEVSHRVSEYIRQALPLFEPVETEYNAPLCQKTFDSMKQAGAFGAPHTLPEELRGREIEFNFESPLHEAIEREKGQRFIETGQMLSQAVQLDPSTAHVVDASAALRDTLKAIQTPAKWLRSEGDVSEKVAEDAQQEQIANVMTQLQEGANVAKTLGEVNGPEAVTPI